MDNSFDAFGEAIEAYYISNGRRKFNLIIESPDFDPDNMSLSYLYRSIDEMPEIEKIALQHAYGKILDVGAGAGPHSFYLQGLNKDVTALEISKKACETMAKRGIKKIINDDVLSHFTDHKYDTIYLLMNGIGLAGSLDNLPFFLNRLKNLLTKNGKILLETTDVNYLYDGASEANSDIYKGEFKFRFVFRGKRGKWFNWLYIEPNLLIDEASKTGLTARILYQLEPAYLLELTKD